MKKLSLKLIFTGSIMGLVILVLFLRSLPDGQTLHIVFCSVGQGDAIYLRFPDGRDMLIDGGPDGSVLECLGRYKPFWSRSINILLLTHSDYDHFSGFREVVKRYSVGTVYSSSVFNDTSEYSELLSLIASRNIHTEYLTRGDSLTIGHLVLTWIWPSTSYLQEIESIIDHAQQRGVSIDGLINRNTTSQIVHLRYQEFDALFTGDADTQVEQNYIGVPLSPDTIEVLKVPHHGSKTGMSAQFLEWLRPELAVISCGRKNRYGHPAQETLSLLDTKSVPYLRTDQQKHIHLITKGKGYNIVK